MNTGFSNRMKDVFTYVREEVLRLGGRSIGVEHLFLGILREGEGTAIRVLKNLGINPNSRLATGFNAPTTEVASVNPDTMARGQQIFGANDPIFGMAKGGIMNTKKAFQRVA